MDFLDLLGVPYHAPRVFFLGTDFLFKFILAFCGSFQIIQSGHFSCLFIGVQIHLTVCVHFLSQIFKITKFEDPSTTYLQVQFATSLEERAI